MANRQASGRTDRIMPFYLAATSLFIAIFTSTTTLARSAEQIDAVVLDEMARQNIVGMAVGIVRNGDILYAKGYGHADLARKRPITTDTIFRWGSVSKTLTAVATLQLAEENPAFDLDDKVSEHVSYWPARGNKGNIRLRHLLSNRSGIIHYKKKKHCPGNPSPEYARHAHSNRTYNAKQAVDVFKHQPLCFDPGTRYKYSTFGYSLLASAIEGASRTDYANRVANRIKRPLGILSLRQATGTNTGFDQRCHVLREVVVGNAAWKLPGGGWESNIVDLAKFANGLLQHKLLDDTGHLWTTVRDNPAYGYGIKYSPDKRRVWHEGKHDNSRTLLYLYPGSKDRLGVVLMINGVHSKPRRIAHHLADLFGRDHHDSKAALVKTCEHRCPGRFSAVWRHTGNDALLRRGYRADNLRAEMSFLHSAGYYTDDVEPYVQDGRIHWDAVFRKGTKTNRVLHDTDDRGFSAKWRALSAKGYRLVDIETFAFAGKRHWAGLFVRDSGRHAMYGRLTAAEFMAKRSELAHQGFRLIDIEPYTSDGALYWAGVWRDGVDGTLSLNLNTQDFLVRRAERLNAGYRLVDIETYQHRGRQLWAGIWEKSAGDERLNINHPFCRTPDQPDRWQIEGITERHNEWQQRGFELTDWERH